jgi:hypothetical protein
MITNIIEGATAVGSNPLTSILQATIPTAYQGNAGSVMQVALVPIKAAMPLVNYLPLPKGSIIMDGHYDPFVALAAGLTISLGNEATGGPVDFGTLTLTTATTRVLLGGANLLLTDNGLTGNSVKLTLSAAPGTLAPEAKPAEGKHEVKPEVKDEAKHEAKHEVKVDPRAHLDPRAHDVKSHAREEKNGEKKAKAVEADEAKAVEADEPPPVVTPLAQPAGTVMGVLVLYYIMQ